MQTEIITAAWVKKRDRAHLVTSGHCNKIKTFIFDEMFYTYLILYF